MRNGVHRPALICSLVFLGAILLIWPVVESGVVDDWSVARSAQLLAETGRIQYNGWEAPMLGWILYFAAALIKVFGFSFTLVRLTSVFWGLLTVVIVQKALRRAGMDAWGSVVGALTLALCPIFLIASVTFTSDMPGLLACVLCFYCCVRALQSRVELQAAIWIAAAAMSNAVLGTARQTAWLGALVMVPSAMWLLRRNRLALVTGFMAWLSSVIFITACLHWLNQQPFVLAESFLVGPARRSWLVVIARTLFRIGLDGLMMLFPVSLGLVSCLRGSRIVLHKTLLWGGGAMLLFLALQSYRSRAFALAPFLYLAGTPNAAENTFLNFGLPILGPSPSHLGFAFRFCLTLGIAVAGLSVLAAMFKSEARERVEEHSARSLPWHDTVVLLLPFAAAYLALLLPRALTTFTVDRYLLPLLPFAVLLLLRLQKRVGVLRDGWLPLALLLTVGVYSVTTLHDAFAIYRANLAAINELRQRGIPRSAISGGVEYNFMTELLQSPFVHAPGIRLPDRSILRMPPDVSVRSYCTQNLLSMTPSVHPLYVISYAGAGCMREPGVLPIRFRTWLPPFQREAQVVRYGERAEIMTHTP